jgi:hypothetical protein
MTTVTINLGAVQARATASADALRSAEEDYARAAEEVAQRLAIVEQRRREHQADQELEAAIMLFAVEGTATGEAQTGRSEQRPTFPLSTRSAAVGVLRDFPSREFALDDLVKTMQSRGYTGTHNAVHVLLSRGISKGDIPIVRVRQGVYKYRSMDVTEMSLGLVSLTNGDDHKEAATG